MTNRIFLYPYAGPGGRNYIKQQGTLQDLERVKITLEEGLVLPLYCDDADDSGKPGDLIFEGIVHFDPEAGWYVLVDEDSYRQASADAG